jgi:hypothetical protein
MTAAVPRQAEGRNPAPANAGTSTSTHGWNPSNGGTSIIYQDDKAEDGSHCKKYELTGRILKQSPNGSRRVILTLQVAEGEQTQLVVLHLIAEGYPDAAVWMTIKHVRKLLCPGVRISVTATASDEVMDERKEDASSSLPTTLHLNAERLVIESVLPAAPYLARLLSFSLEELHQLFPTTAATACTGSSSSVSPTPTSRSVVIPPSLVTALRPCEASLCEHLVTQICIPERAAGRTATLFKRPELTQLGDRIRDFQCWTRARSSKPAAPTKRFAWEALERLEHQWCREIIDGPIEEYGAIKDDEHDEDRKQEKTPPPPIRSRLVFGDMDVDPSLNLPDPTDARRVQYIDERKRPQIQYMLRLILRLLDCEQLLLEEQQDGTTRSPKDMVLLSDADPSQVSPRHLHLVDIGGGRGDLAMTVAAFFGQPHILRDHHIRATVTVLDVNESSLQAGDARAQQIGLDNMSFVLCDVADPAQIDKFLRIPRQQQQDSNNYYNVLFGLHCCGGLAEAAVELALRAGAHFCVSTCCFRSNPSLASLTRLSESIVLQKGQGDQVGNTTTSSTTTSNATDGIAETYQEDLHRVSILATGASTGGQHRAIRVLNSIRLVAAEQRFREYYAADTRNSNSRNRTKLKVWQESFPLEYSVQNRVLVGRYE